MPGSTSKAGEIVERVPTPPPAAKDWLLPAEFGQVVFRKNSQDPRQIYIIGQSHRSALSGQGGADTVKIQAEIYRIGEWLIQQKQVELLLPEGFFPSAPHGRMAPPEYLGESPRLDSQTLETRLSNTSRFVNADLLLNAGYHIRLGQIEDKLLYGKIRNLLRRVGREAGFSSLAELDRLQTARTAVILQNIPDVVEKAFLTGSIANRQAILTLGLAHVGDIVKALQRGFLGSPAVSSGLAPGERTEERLKLLDQGYGVTVIIPRTLVAHEQVIRLAQWAKE